MGVGEYWIVDPEIEAVKVFRLNAGRYERTELRLEDGDVLTSLLFPGLQLPLKTVFEMP
jgi:Uma2 family endonuclease